MPAYQILERLLGFTTLADLCPEGEALRDINGTYNCPPEALTALRILRFADLHTRPEFGADMRQENNNNGTIALLISLHLQLNFWRKSWM